MSRNDYPVSCLISWWLSHKGQDEQTVLDKIGSGSNTTTSTSAGTSNDPVAAAAAATAGRITGSVSYQNPHNSIKSEHEAPRGGGGGGSGYVQDPAEFLSRIAEAESEKSKARRLEPSWDS